jgi:hypothetical protein
MTLDHFRGADRDRTDDLLVANEALSQLSYSPETDAQRFKLDGKVTIFLLKNNAAPILQTLTHANAGNLQVFEN